MSRTGPGYASPLDAMKNGPREELLYVICVQPNQTESKTDLLATIDVNPESPTYCHVIHRLRTGYPNDELHHSGWNVCSSCHCVKGDCKIPVRDKLILPALGSSRIYVVDVGKNPRKPFFHKIIDGSKVRDVDCSFLHSTHCLPSGEVMISAMGDKNEKEKCDYVLVDSNTFEVKGTWVKGKSAKFNYDFWYQPYFDVMVSTEWGTPGVFKYRCDPGDFENYYGRSLNFFSWSKRKLIQSIDLGEDGIAPLEVRFLHNPKEPQGYVGCGVSGNVFRFYLKSDGTWAADKVIQIPPKKVLANGKVENMSAGITDIIISLDDKYLYTSNHFQGDVRQYDITDRAHPKLTGRIFLGGRLLTDSGIKIVEDPEGTGLHEPVYLKGKRFRGANQMMQLSLDGKRLYVSNSLFSPWDKQFHPDVVAYGGGIARIDIDVENGGMKLDPDFYVDFGEGPDGPLLPHQMRYPGGDCTSDIWLVEE